MDVCVIVGAGPLDGRIPACREGDLVIAADGGAAALQSRGLTWDLAVGDFDSLGRVPETGCVVSHPVMKDETDMLLAVREGYRRGCRTFLLFGGLGGRPDHSLANLQVLWNLAEQGCRGFLLGGGTVVTAVRDGRIDFDEGHSGTVSVLCAGERAEGVTLRGLRYRLDNAVLLGSEPLGVSNEFTGVPSSITVERGVLWVFWNEEPERLLGRLHTMD
jgi:thiamine pyrophosphokinase